MSVASEPMRRRRWLWALGAASVALLVGPCRPGSGFCIAAGPPYTDTLVVGQTQAVRAGHLDILDECDRPWTRAVRWSTPTPTVVAVDASGQVRALAPGEGRVVARSGLERRTWRVTVAAPEASPAR